MYSSRAAISLFDALTQSENGLIFPEDTIQAVSSAVSEFHKIAVVHGVPRSHMMVLATEAMRRATNGSSMLTAIAGVTNGIGVHILNPSVETLLGAVMGSRSGLIGVPRGALFLDLGGGSVQMTWVDTSEENYEVNAALAGESLPFGAAKLAKVLLEQTEQVQTSEVQSLRDGIARIYATLCKRFPKLAAIREAHNRGDADSSMVDVYMCGGGFRGYGSMLMHRDPTSPYPIPSTSTYSVHGSHFARPTEMRQVNDLECDTKIFGMSKRRRAQFPAIATVIEAFTAAVPNIGRVTFCGGSNRQGALMMMLPREIRESNPLHVLASITSHETALFQTTQKLLCDAVPAEVLQSAVPTILSPGLVDLFIRQIWSRRGHGSSSNSAFALHDAVVRDPDCPGLTHLARVLLALTTCARWEAALGPSDMRLYSDLRDVLDSYHKDAPFWALYLGGVAHIVAETLAFPEHESTLLSTAIR